MRQPVSALEEEWSNSGSRTAILIAASSAAALSIVAFAANRALEAAHLQIVEAPERLARHVRV
jgi:hypothetical protein